MKAKLARAALVVAMCVLAALPGRAAAAKDKGHGQARGGSYLVQEIGHQLRLLPYYSVFDNLEYRVNGYNVELSGEVTRPTLKSDAERVVKKIEGVENVTNNIKVLPLSPSDDRIRLAEYRAIYGQSALNRYALQAVPPIHIIVDNGHVTLMGVVASEMDKNVAGIQANGVPGVFSVTNNLRVEKVEK
jgi:hyperosmotically inducible periplasmic protein